MFKRERLAAHIQRSIAEELQRRFPGHYISVTEVVVSEGSRHAVVWVSILAETGRDEIFEEILSLEGQLRSSITKGAKLRQVPQIDIKLDERMQRAQDIGKII